MKIFYCDQYVIPLPEGHGFPIRKYALLRQRVAEAGLGTHGELQFPRAATDAEIELVHDPDYIRRVWLGLLSRKEILRIGFPWSEALVERARRSCGGTIEACRAALKDGIAVNLGGGTHHAFRDHGQGYCIFNDCAIAARAMQAEGRARRILIIDCDAHQGNGTAAIFANDPTVFTFSIHSARTFPMRKEKSDVDVALADGTDDDRYMEALERGLRRSLERARAELAIYLAGADPFAGDRFGRLALSHRGLAERDKLVFHSCQSEGIPVAVTMAGGYARRLADTVDIHLQTIRLAVEIARGHRAGVPLVDPNRDFLKFHEE